MELSFQLADPAGNITLLVTTPVPREDHPTLAAGLLSIPELHAEQVGFLVPPQGAGVIRLEMMGGEFCGNALRCAGLYYAVQQGRRRAGRFPVEVSGRYFAPCLSGGSFSSRIGWSSRICRPWSKPSTPRRGIKIPDVRV